MWINAQKYEEEEDIEAEIEATVPLFGAADVVHRKAEGEEEYKDELDKPELHHNFGLILAKMLDLDVHNFVLVSALDCDQGLYLNPVEGHK